MKRALTIVAGVLLMAGTTVSCQKCYECTNDTLTGEDVVTVCDGPTEADDRAENLEADGYSCTVK